MFSLILFHAHFLPNYWISVRFNRHPDIQIYVLLTDLLACAFRTKVLRFLISNSFTDIQIYFRHIDHVSCTSRIKLLLTHTTVCGACSISGGLGIISQCM